MKNLSITEFLKGRNELLPNLDPDGLYTYVLINKYIKSKIIGFTNSKNCVYFLDDVAHISSKTITYVDMFVSNPKIQSIDQHIITRDYNETKALVETKTKLNPNLLFNRDLTCYRTKFPLATFHFVMLLLAEEYDFEIDWHKKITDDLELGHLILDVDGVLTNLRDYNANVKAWLDVLKEECSNKKLINSFYDYINTIPILELKSISDRVRTFLKENFNTETKDGGFKTLSEENVGNIVDMIDFISTALFNEKFEESISLDKMQVWEGEYSIGNSGDIKLSDTFSYAIVRANGTNFSYTKKLKKKE